LTPSIQQRLVHGLLVAAACATCVLVVVVGYQYGFLGPNPPSLSDSLSEILHHVLLPLAVFAGFFGLGAVIAVRAVTRQLRDAAESLETASTGGRVSSVRVKRLPAEVQPFARAVERVTSRLHDYAARQEAFALDAAHELKTPLGIIALELDSLNQLDARRMGEQVKALSSMIDQLLLLARAQAADVAAAQAMVDLERIGSDLVAEMAPGAIACKKGLAFESDKPAPVRGLNEALQSTVRSLVVNALLATPPGGEVIIRAGPGAQLTVLDGGPGLDSQQLEHFKARGARCDQAGGGAGLGLAIADRVIEAHGGWIETCWPERSGLRICFPGRNVREGSVRGQSLERRFPGP